MPSGAEPRAQSRPEGGNLKATPCTALIALLTAFVAPRVLAADEPSEVHAFVEASTSRGMTLRAWGPRQSYSVSMLRLGELGQGFGTRLTLLPPPNFTGVWELSADAVIRLANRGPLYVKPMGGIAVASPGALWPPRIRAGTEVGLTAIRGRIGFEMGLVAVYSFPPSSALEGEWMFSAGVGVLFGFGTPAPAPTASSREARAGERPSLSANAVLGTVLGAAPTAGGFNTCEGSKATPQCLQAMSESAGAASTRATSLPKAGTTTSTAAPTAGATSSTAPAAAPGTTPARLPLKPLSIAGSIWAALTGPSDEQRQEQAEHDRLMKQSARTLEEQKLELPNGKPNTPITEPGGYVAPRVESNSRAPQSTPSTSRDQAIAEPDGELQTPLELHNPRGQHGNPDHKATVERLKELARREFPNGQIEAGKSILQETGVNRRPDVSVRDLENRRVLKVYEAARIGPDGRLPKREQAKKDEYDQAGIPSHFEPVNP